MPRWDSSRRTPTGSCRRSASSSVATTRPLELFRDAGAQVDGVRVRFEPGLARQLCSTAPRQFSMWGRDGRRIEIGGDHVIFTPTYGPPFVMDLDEGRRYATIDDFRNFVKLTWMSPWLAHGSGTVCEPVDVPVNKRHLDMVDAHLRWSAKPFMGAVTAPEGAEDSIAMARIVFGAEYMETHCVIQGNVNVNSPLVWDATMSGALKALRPGEPRLPDLAVHHRRRHGARHPAGPGGAGPCRGHDRHRAHPARAARLADDLRQLPDHDGPPLGSAPRSARPNPRWRLTRSASSPGDWACRSAAAATTRPRRSPMPRPCRNRLMR